LELAYAPQFGAAKDPVNMAGFVAANILKGDMEEPLSIKEKKRRGARRRTPDIGSPSAFFGT